MSKKGGIPVTLLVIGVFAICCFALLTFLIADFKATTSFAGVNVMKNLTQNIEEYNSYKNIKNISEDKLSIMFNLKEINEQKCFYYEERDKKAFSRLQGDYGSLVFSVQYCP